MEITINHVVTLSPETLEVLKGFLSSAPVTTPKTAKTKVEKTETIASAEPVTTQPTLVSGTNIVNPSPAEEPKLVTQADIKANVAAGYTMEQVRAEAQEVAKAGKRNEVKAELDRLGAANVPGLDKAYYADFMAFLAKLKA
jgi:hypothetical protein